MNAAARWTCTHQWQSGAANLVGRGALIETEDPDSNPKGG
jgi:hypothetical protein